MSEPTVPVAETRILTMPRRRSAGLVLGAASLTTLGGLMIGYGSALGWVVAGFFGIGGLVAAVGLVRPPTLRLDRDGFTLRESFRRPRRRRWADCSPFVVWRRGKHQRLGVAYASDQDDWLPLRAVNTFLAGGDETIRLGFGALKAEELAELLNGYRLASVGEDEDYRFLERLQAEAMRPGQRPSLVTRVLHGALLWLGLAVLGVAYVAYQVDGPAQLVIPSAIAGAALFAAYVWWTPE